MATNFAVWPMTVIGCEEGTMEMEVRPVTGVELRFTCTFDEPCTIPKVPFTVAVMTATPVPCAVTTPEESTVATDWEFDAQFALLVTSCVVGGWDPS